MSALPRPVQPLVSFSPILRAHGFAVGPEQTIGFIEAVGLLGPESIDDIFRAGVAIHAPPRERLAEYEALFRAHFVGQTVAASTDATDDEDETEAHEEKDGTREEELRAEDEPSGAEASRAETLSHRELGGAGDDAALTRFRRAAPSRLPLRRSRRRHAARHGRELDMRRALRKAVTRDGELFELPRRHRTVRPRRICLLVDVSGSMERQVEPTMRFAHALVQAGERVEVFTIGTRLTRATRALSDRREAFALDRVGRLVADFDGGTRIGEALGALLAVPRFAAALRGAYVIAISDGLERGDATAMVDTVRRVSRLAWRLDWLTPLAVDLPFEPRTEALSASARFIDRFGSAADLARICDHVLTTGRAA